VFEALGQQKNHHLSKRESMIEQRLKDLIDRKANDLNSKDYSLSKEVSRYIDELTSYINEEKNIEDENLEKYLDQLIGYFTTTLTIPLSSGLKILRARQFNSPHLEKDVQELSYIAKSNSHFSRMGRMNKDGESIYYGCIYFNDEYGGVNVSFSEVHAKPKKTINVLRSETKEEINSYFIGIYDYVFRGKRPYYISEKSFDYFKKIYDYQKKKYTEDAFMAHQLTDAFFSDILTRNEHGNLYKVTSKLSGFFLETPNIDAIIFSSVQAEGSPVIAIKPTSVDKKLTHLKADCFYILDDYGYAFYNAKLTHNGCINNGSITWTKL